jgi:O-methyltransferase
MASKLARDLQTGLSRAIFWGRRRFLEPTLDSKRDSVVLPVATHSPWLLDEDFQRLQAAIAKNTLVDLYRRWELWHLIGQVRDIPGDVLEVGVWRGGTGALMGARLQLLGCDATLHLCDTFEGVVKTSDADSHYSGGEHSDTSVPLVESLLSATGVTNARIHRGTFPDEAPAELSELQYRLVHIDVDVYESGRQIFEWAWPRLSAGGIVVFDDYGFSTTRGITRLCDELALRADAVLLQNLNGHAVMVKHGSSPS